MYKHVLPPSVTCQDLFHSAEVYNLVLSRVSVSATSLLDYTELLDDRRNLHLFPDLLVLI